MAKEQLVTPYHLKENKSLMTWGLFGILMNINGIKAMNTLNNMLKIIILFLFLRSIKLMGIVLEFGLKVKEQANQFHLKRSRNSMT